MSDIRATSSPFEATLNIQHPVSRRIATAVPEETTAASLGNCVRNTGACDGICVSSFPATYKENQNLISNLLNRLLTILNDRSLNVLLTSIFFAYIDVAYINIFFIIADIKNEFL